MRREVACEQERVAGVLACNREALERLFESGLVFTRQGSQMGRELLRSQHELLRAKSMLARLLSGPVARCPIRAELDAVVQRAELAARRFAAWLSPA